MAPSACHTSPCPSTAPLHELCNPKLTRSLVSIWARFLCWILMMPGGWIQASPSTCTGTPSSPRMVIFTTRHCGADSLGLASQLALHYWLQLPCQG